MLQNDNFFLNDNDFVELTDRRNLMRSKIELKVRIQKVFCFKSK